MWGYVSKCRIPWEARVALVGSASWRDLSRGNCLSLSGLVRWGGGLVFTVVGKIGGGAISVGSIRKKGADGRGASLQSRFPVMVQSAVCVRDEGEGSRICGWME